MPIRLINNTLSKSVIFGVLITASLGKIIVVAFNKVDKEKIVLVLSLPGCAVCMYGGHHTYCLPENIIHGSKYIAGWNSPGL
jgi:hypothetical protein